MVHRRDSLGYRSPLADRPWHFRGPSAPFRLWGRRNYNSQEAIRSSQRSAPRPCPAPARSQRYKRAEWAIGAQSAEEARAHAASVAPEGSGFSVPGSGVCVCVWGGGGGALSCWPGVHSTPPGPGGRANSRPPLDLPLARSCIWQRGFSRARIVGSGWRCSAKKGTELLPGGEFSGREEASCAGPGGAPALEPGALQPPGIPGACFPGHPRGLAALWERSGDAGSPNVDYLESYQLSSVDPGLFALVCGLFPPELAAHLEVKPGVAASRGGCLDPTRKSKRKGPKEADRGQLLPTHHSRLPTRRPCGTSPCSQEASKGQAGLRPPLARPESWI
uniref:uncharacterized protein LOC123463554 n=1 Tax=Jaculus jaculus TaxID=51337 RepID=UPI001E1B10D1|nr:uncharacterized protein LOC123463554 [Jaculus jaculus]